MTTRTRTRRIAVTLAAATGIAGVAGATAGIATGADHQPVAAASTESPSAPGVTSTDPARQQLADYLAQMEQQAAGLDERVTAARRHLARAVARRARLVARARARALAAAQARAAAAEAAQAAAQQATRAASRPATHTTTGASGATGSGEREHEGGDDD